MPYGEDFAFVVHLVLFHVFDFSCTINWLILFWLCYMYCVYCADV